MAKQITKAEINKIINCTNDSDFMYYYEKACNEEGRPYSFLNDDKRHEIFKGTGINERAARILKRQREIDLDIPKNPKQPNEVLAKKTLILISGILGVDPITKKPVPQISDRDAYIRCLEMDEEYSGIGFLESANFFKLKMKEEEVPF